MKNYSNVSKFGITVSAIAVTISAIDIFYKVIRMIPVSRTSIGTFFCILTIFFANIAISQHNKKRKINKP
jgi:uncharacterized membrane protein YidH (DUF202 family)